MATDLSPCTSGFVATLAFPSGVLGPVLLVHGLFLRIVALSERNPRFDSRYDLGIDYLALLSHPSLLVRFFFERSVPEYSALAAAHRGSLDPRLWTLSYMCSSAADTLGRRASIAHTSSLLVHNLLGQPPAPSAESAWLPIWRAKTSAPGLASFVPVPSVQSRFLRGPPPADKLEPGMPLPSAPLSCPLTSPVERIRGRQVNPDASFWCD